MPRIVFPEFRDQFEFTRYPFADGASLRSSEAGLDVGIDTFLDAAVYPIGGAGRIYLSSVIVESARDVTLVISDENQLPLASVEFDPIAAPDLLRLTDAFDRPAGVLVSESLKLARFGAWEAGTHTFELGATEFVAAVVIPTPEIGVRGFLTEAGELVAGDAWLVGDNGIVIREDGTGVIRIDIVGDPLFVRKLCTEVELFNPPNFIKTINGCPPDEFGAFNITVGAHLNNQTIMRIYPTNDGLIIGAAGQVL